ncbi:MAG: hypothetical protein H0U56_08555 [Methylibium sp.]|nr:hypothetical protein [Methylibium sp.]
MKHILLAAALSLAAPAFAADVGVSVEISQPGVYGRVDIGRYPQPQVIVAQPIFVQRPTVVVQRPDPVYLWVPPGHRKNWKKHCRDYSACGVPVYFVKDDWYDSNVRHADFRDHRRDDRREDRFSDRGYGKDKEKKGKGKDKHD